MSGGVIHILVTCRIDHKKSNVPLARPCTPNQISNGGVTHRRKRHANATREFFPEIDGNALQFAGGGILRHLQSSGEQNAGPERSSRRKGSSRFRAGRRECSSAAPKNQPNERSQYPMDPT